MAQKRALISKSPPFFRRSKSVCWPCFRPIIDVNRMEHFMIFGLIKRIVKLAVYGVGFGCVVGVWDFMQQSQATEGNFTLEDYAVSVTDRYGAQVREFADDTMIMAQTGVDHGLTWIASFSESGLPISDSPAHDETTASVSVPEHVSSLDALVVLASAEQSAAPESSLYPRARGAQ
ncbi:hypothetical protein ACG74X_13545 [Marivita sp. S0852]|uniref:hypothetical protein n=1 Tax=Marivita sp. S0852 TaxID=3373893 RepID=UPI003981C2E7